MTVFGSILILVSSVSKYLIIPALDVIPDDFLEAIFNYFLVYEIAIYKGYERKERDYFKWYYLDR